MFTKRLRTYKNVVLSYWKMRFSVFHCPVVQLEPTFGWCFRQFSWPLPCHQWGRMKSVPANVIFGETGNSSTIHYIRSVGQGDFTWHHAYLGMNLVWDPLVAFLDSYLFVSVFVIVFSLLFIFVSFSENLVGCWFKSPGSGCWIPRFSICIDEPPHGKTEKRLWTFHKFDWDSHHHIITAIIICECEHQKFQNHNNCGL